MSIHVYDSFKRIELPDHRVFAVTYEPEWQGVRAMCSFRSNVDTRKSLARLEAYLAAPGDDEDKRRRFYRVHNLLNAIPLGQSSIRGVQNIMRSVENTLVPYRQAVAERARRAGPPTEWDWDVSRRQLRVLWDKHPDQMGRAWAELKRRAARKEPKSELRYYLEMMEEVADDA